MTLPDIEGRREWLLAAVLGFGGASWVTDNPSALIFGGLTFMSSCGFLWTFPAIKRPTARLARSGSSRFRSVCLKYKVRRFLPHVVSDERQLEHAKASWLSAPEQSRAYSRADIYRDLGAYLMQGERLAWWLEWHARVNAGDLSWIAKAWGDMPENDEQDLLEWRKAVWDYLFNVVSEGDAARVFSHLEDPLPIEPPKHLTYATRNVALWKETQLHLRRLRQVMERYEPRGKEH